MGLVILGLILISNNKVMEVEMVQRVLERNLRKETVKMLHSYRKYGDKILQDMVKIWMFSLVEYVGTDYVDH